MLLVTSNNKRRLHKVRRTMILTSVPMLILEIAGIILLAANGIWWLLALYAILAVPFSILISKYYYNNVDYMCPHCNKVFAPSFKEMFWAAHTPTKRKLTCPDCGKKEWCTEVAKELN